MFGKFNFSQERLILLFYFFYGFVFSVVVPFILFIFINVTLRTPKSDFLASDLAKVIVHEYLILCKEERALSDETFKYVINNHLLKKIHPEYVEKFSPGEIDLLIRYIKQQKKNNTQNESDQEITEYTESYNRLTNFYLPRNESRWGKNYEALLKNSKNIQTYYTHLAGAINNVRIREFESTIKYPPAIVLFSFAVFFTFIFSINYYGLYFIGFTDSISRVIGKKWNKNRIYLLMLFSLFVLYELACEFNLTFKTKYFNLDFNQSNNVISLYVTPLLYKTEYILFLSSPFLLLLFFAYALHAYPKLKSIYVEQYTVNEINKHQSN